VLILDPGGRERERNKGYLQKSELEAWLEMSLARLASKGKRWTEAEERFYGIVHRFPQSGVAAYAVYRRRVSRNKLTQDQKDLFGVTGEVKQGHRDSIWAKKAEVWKAQMPSVLPSQMQYRSPEYTPGYHARHLKPSVCCHFRKDQPKPRMAKNESERIRAR